MKEERIVYKLDENNEWVLVLFKDLKSGELFKMFEPDFVPVSTSDGRTNFRACSNPYLNEDDVWQIDTLVREE